MRLIDVLRSLLGGSRPTPRVMAPRVTVPKPTHAPAATNAAAPVPPVALHAVPAPPRTSMHAGKLQLIGLATIKARFGLEWEAVRDKAMGMAAKAIRRRLTDVDVFAPVNGEAFVVLFVGLDEEQAKFKALSIAREIESLLCGELEGGYGLKVSSHVVGLRDVANKPDLGSSEAFAAWVDRAIREADEGDVLHSSDTAAPAFHESEAHLIDIDPIASVRTEFVPTFNVRQKVIASYTCGLVRVDAEGNVVARQNIYPEGGQGSMTRDLDRLALEAAGRALRVLEDSPSPAGIIVPLHFDTVSTILHRNQFMDAVRSLPNNAQKLLTVELCATPPGTPEGRVLEVLGVFKAFCRFVVMRIPFDPRAIGMVPQGPVVAVSTVVGPGLSSDVMIDRMSQFTERARRHQLNVVLAQEAHPDTAANAVRCGFTHVSGDVAGPPVKQPGGIHSYSPPFMRIVDVLNAATAAHQECA